MSKCKPTRSKLSALMDDHGLVTKTPKKSPLKKKLEAAHKVLNAQVYSSKEVLDHKKTITKLKKELKDAHEALDLLASEESSEDSRWKEYYSGLFEKELAHWKDRATNAENKVISLTLLT